MTIPNGPILQENQAALEFSESIPVEDGADADFAPNQGGRIVVFTRSSGNWEVTITRKPGLDYTDKQDFDFWARQRVYHLIISGTPELDGWFQREDGGWQLTARDATA